MTVLRINCVCFIFSKLGSAGLQMADDTIVITPDHLHVDKVTEIVGSPSAGAISLFVGKFFIND